jgi:hypothetical protein
MTSHEEQYVYSQDPRNVYLDPVSQCFRREEGDSLKKYCLAAGDFAQFMKDLFHQYMLVFRPSSVPRPDWRGSRSTYAIVISVCEMRRD